MNPELPRPPAPMQEETPPALYSRVVHGYHGCSQAVAERILRGEPFVPSANGWDWLGNGIYFWEYGPDRALRWAGQQRPVKDPAVVGAMIQLGSCLDLLDTRSTTLLRSYYPRWLWLLQSRGDRVPENRGKARYRDRSVIEGLIQESQELGLVYDCVRAAFIEGEPVFPGSALHMETHIQIAVRNAQCIVGVFRLLTEKT